jgi:hypothetical protein
MITVSIIAVKLSRYTRRMILLGSLSYQPRGNLSVFTDMYYKAECSSYQENSGFKLKLKFEVHNQHFIQENYSLDPERSSLAPFLS